MPDKDENAEGVNDPIETTGDGETPAADGIEGEAEAAAVAAAEAAPEPEPEPEPEPAPAATAKPATAAKAKAKPTARRRQTAGKKNTDADQQIAHRAAVKAARPEPAKVEPAVLTADQAAEVDAKKENRERLRALKDEIAELDATRAALVEEQQVLASFGAVVADNRPHHVRHQEVLKRSTELRQQRVKDRLKLLAKSAAKSPLDIAMGAGPRKSQAAADAKTTDEKSE